MRNQRPHRGKSACVLGLTSRFEAAGGLLRNLVDHSHIRQKACGLWGFGHRAVVLTCFNQCARCPPEWTSEPCSIPHPNPELHYARLCCHVRLSNGCLRSPIGAASKAPSLCNHVSRDVHTARRTAMAGFIKSSMMVFASSLGARATASGCSPATAMILRSVFRRSPWRWRLRQWLVRRRWRAIVVDRSWPPAKGALALAFDERIQKDLANVL